MKKPGKLSILIILAAVGSLALSACGGSKADTTPTVAAIQTSAVSTFAAGLTQTALSLPTNTPTETPTISPTATATSSTPLATATSAVPTTFCYGLILVKDVTIPDGTVMAPGQTFTKTWQVQNTGTCNWDAGFKFVFVSGDRMGGVPLALTQPVSPNGETEISIAMTAPSTIGKIVGHWRMSTTSGTLFGADVFVSITVASPTATTTGAVTATATGGAASATPATPTVTATP
jgi:hypothetical protein